MKTVVFSAFITVLSTSYVNLFSLCYSPGYIYNGIYVVRVLETVPKTNKAQCKKVASASMETVVHSNTFCTQVI